jgi:hypothetical protein
MGLDRKVKTGVALFCLFVIVTAALPAKQFSIQIGQFDDSSANITDASLQFEDALMEYFFDAGHIVSNAPSVIIEDPDNAPVAQAIREAREGSLEYLASVVLVYKKNVPVSSNSGNALQYAAWKLYDVTNGKEFSSGKVQFADFYQQDAQAAVRNCAVSLSRDVTAALGGF